MYLRGTEEGEDGGLREEGGGEVRCGIQMGSSNKEEVVSGGSRHVRAVEKIDRSEEKLRAKVNEHWEARVSSIMISSHPMQPPVGRDPRYI